MEAAYDHIQEEVLNSDEKKKPAENKEATQEGSLNTDLQDAYRSFSSSAWGVKLGGFLGSVRKQGESYYQSARDEASVASEEALKGFTDLKSSLVSRTRGLSLGSASPPPNPSQPLEPVDATAPAVPSTDGATTSRDAAPDATSPDSEGFITRFRAEADKRLKEIQRAEDAADEALLKFGTNIRNFLRDAVTIAPPSFDDDELTSGQGATQGGEPQGGKVLFESKDAEGRRVIHTTRLDAQLHVIHCSLDSFTKDPASPQWEAWRKEFEVGTRTEEIAADLEKYEELRRAMERLVPDKVTYEAFWARYYFLRMVIASEEQRRKEMLKGAALGNEEEVGWDEDSDDEPVTPQASDQSPRPDATATPKATNEGLSVKPSEPRTSQDQNSQSGSDESYDLVSGAASSREPGSPREEKDKEKDREKAKEGGMVVEKKEESDEEDWE